MLQTLYVKTGCYLTAPELPSIPLWDILWYSFKLIYIISLISFVSLRILYVTLTKIFNAHPLWQSGKLLDLEL